MLTTLIVSRPGTRGALRRQLPGLTFSMAAHAVLFYAAAMATMHQETDERSVATDTLPIYVSTRDQQPLEPRPPIQRGIFRTLVPPVNIPIGIPPIDLTQPFDPRDYTGMGVPVGPGPATGGLMDMTRVFIDSLIDEPPVRIAFPPPEYPRLLLQARIEGSVILEAVIDTLGHPEPASIKVIFSTNRAFEPAAKEALRGALYRVGRLHGQRVRVLVRQPLRFQLPR